MNPESTKFSEAQIEGALEQVRTLWPYMSFPERMEWASKLKPLFRFDFAATVDYLSRDTTSIEHTESVEEGT